MADGKLAVYEYSDNDKIKIGKEIADLYKKGEFTIEGCCIEKGVNVRTFHGWCKRFAELADYFKNAKLSSDGRFDAKSKVLARRKVLARLEGLDFVKRHKILYKTKTKTLSFNNPEDFLDFIKQASETSEEGEIAISEETIQVSPSDSFLLGVLSNVDEWTK